MAHGRETGSVSRSSGFHRIITGTREGIQLGETVGTVSILSAIRKTIDTHGNGDKNTAGMQNFIG